MSHLQHVKWTKTGGHKTGLKVLPNFRLSGERLWTGTPEMTFKTNQLPLNPAPSKWNEMEIERQTLRAETVTDNRAGRGYKNGTQVTEISPGNNPGSWKKHVETTYQV